MMTLEDFLNLITSEHADKPKFIAFLSEVLQPIAENIAVNAHIPTDYDIDEAIGHQLDVIGEWVGASRYLGTMLPDVFFTWDDPDLGWDRGIWKRATDPDTGITVLDDESYRIYLKARIAANNWDGSISQLYDIWQSDFFSPLFFMLVQDGSAAMVPYLTWDSTPARGWDYSGWLPEGVDVSDMRAAGGMSMSYVLIKNTEAGELSKVIEQLFINGYLTVKPAGVQIDAYVTQSVADAPVFAWDCGPTSGAGVTAPPTMLAGWDIGAWGIEHKP